MQNQSWMILLIPSAEHTQLKIADCAMNPLVSSYLCTFGQNDLSSSKNHKFSQKLGTVIGILCGPTNKIGRDCSSCHHVLVQVLVCPWVSDVSSDALYRPDFVQGVQKGIFLPYAGLSGQCLLYLQHVPITAVMYTLSPSLPCGVFYHAWFAEFCSG